MLTSAFAALTLGPYALGYITVTETGGAVQKAMALMAFIMDVTFAIALSLFVVAHFYMAAKNQTSLEGERESRRYNRGWKKNMQSVFGKDPRFWFVPMHRSQLVGDGIHWPLGDGSWDGHADKEKLPSDEEER